MVKLRVNKGLTKLIDDFSRGVRSSSTVLATDWRQRSRLKEALLSPCHQRWVDAAASASLTYRATQYSRSLAINARGRAPSLSSIIIGRQCGQREYLAEGTRRFRIAGQIRQTFFRRWAVSGQVADNGESDKFCL